MLLLGWFLLGCLLTPCVPGTALEVSGYGSHEVICSQGLSDCTMKDETALAIADDGVDVQNWMAHFKLCCKEEAACVLCLVVDANISIEHRSTDVEDEETRNPNVSVTVCYRTGSTLPMCKKVEFTVNHSAVAQENQAKIHLVIPEPTSISFSSFVFVYLLEQPHLGKKVTLPSLDEVCSQELHERIQECHVPRISSVINLELNQVELQFPDSFKSLPSVCVQYEDNGKCQTLNKTTVPLYSVAPCMCFQAWNEDHQRSRRSQSCPFINMTFLQRNVWQNVSVSVSQGLSGNLQILWWNVTAPCRLEGEVWPCTRGSSCREIDNFRQQLTKDSWKQNSKGHWVRTGDFEDINLQLSPCVMVKLRGMEHPLGPFCFNNTERLRWTLLVIGVMLLLCLSLLFFYLLHDFVKKCMRSWHKAGFVEIDIRRHVVLLSPPDMDHGVSESVCRLGSLLSNQGLSVCVDQWSRKEQCAQGPLLWLHSKLLEVKSQDGRIVVILTPKALERAQEWTSTCHLKEVVCIKGRDEGFPQTGSPYSDVFMGSLLLIQAEEQQGRAGEHFLLVKFDSHPCGDSKVPELLQGLPLFQLPSQTKAFMAELTEGRTSRGKNRRTWTM
ncbi:uncharacterized protein V6R79_006440 [Siganus canaliculatus]